MAEIHELKPWVATTPGERLFLLTYEFAKNSIPKINYDGSGIVSVEGLSEFLRLVATMELTHRIINASCEVLDANEHASPDLIAKNLRTTVELYGPPTVIYKFAEQGRLAGIAYINQKLTEGQINATHKNEKKYCCWCGTHTIRGKAATRREEDFIATVEHLWPEFLGGTSELSNLIVACQKCNSARQHAYTWAWFALQACNEKLDENGSLPRHIHLAIALYRLMLVAGGGTRIVRKPVTLKEAAKALKSSFPKLDLVEGRRYTFFEIFNLVKE